MGPILVESVPRPAGAVLVAALASLGLALAAALAPVQTPASQIAPTMQESASDGHPIRREPHRCGLRKSY